MVAGFLGRDKVTDQHTQLSRAIIRPTFQIFSALALNGLMVSASAASPPAIDDRHQSNAETETIYGATFDIHRTRDRLGRTITYRIMRTARPSPILLMVQGSGCEFPVTSKNDRILTTVAGLEQAVRSGKAAVLVVDKPFSMSGSVIGTAKGCSPEFNEDFTAERWLIALESSLDAASRLPGTDHSKVLAMGVSEGAAMVSMLAGRDRRITDVVAISGAGTSQLFDLFALAYQNCFNRQACVDEVERHARAILANPESSKDFYQGHAYKRWSSFFKVDASQELSRSKARIYWVFGTADNSVPALSGEVAAAKLLAEGARVTIRRVADAGHGLTDGSGRLNAAEYSQILNWLFENPGPAPEGRV